MDAVFKKEGASCIIIKFMTIIALNELNTRIKVSEHICVEVA